MRIFADLLYRMFIQTGPRRVYQHGGKFALVQRQPLYLAAGFLALENQRQVFRWHAQHIDIVDAVFLDVPLGRAHRHLGDFSSHHAAEVLCQRQGKVAVAAVELDQITAGVSTGVDRPLDHLLADMTVGLGKAIFGLLVTVGAAVDVQRFDHEIVVQHDLLLA